MNKHERDRKREIGLAFLADVVADVLMEAQGDGQQGWLRVDQIRIGAGFSGGKSANDTCRGVLHHLLQRGDVERKKTGATEYLWRWDNSRTWL